jgi:hypothetical protein
VNAGADYRCFAWRAFGLGSAILYIFMHSCKNADMRTSLDFPDALFKHLKTRAAQEGRTLRDLVVELVEKGLSARDLVDAQQRFQARPLITGTSPMRLPPSQLNSADLSDILSEEDDERARQILQSR